MTRSEYRRVVGGSTGSESSVYSRISSGSTRSGERERDSRITPGVVGMAHADMAEGIDDAFMAEDAVGNCKFFDELGQLIRHGLSPHFWQPQPAAAVAF